MANKVNTKNRERAKRETNLNPFVAYGTKETWEKIMESIKNDKPVKFPGIGIEKTPLYRLQ